jgi:hypothetical protein
VKRLLIIVAVLAGLALPGTTGAAVPCRNKVFNDWYHDGRIASSYPLGCYRDALKHIPADARIYSSLSTDISSAMLAAIRHQHGKVVPKQVGRGFKVVAGSKVVAAGRGAGTGVLVSSGQAPAPPASSDPSDPTLGVVAAPASSGLADTASNAPLPILVLGGVALALVAAGGIGVGVRRVRQRG